MENVLNFQIGLWTPVGCLQSPGGASYFSLEENQTGFSIWQHHSRGVFLRSQTGSNNLIINWFHCERQKMTHYLMFFFVCLHQYVTLRTRYSELMTLTSQYIKFITDSQRRLEDEEVRDNWLRIPNKLNPNINLTNQIINQPTNEMTRRSPKRMHAPTFLCVPHKYAHITLMYGWQIVPLHWVSMKHWHAVAHLQD